MTTKNMTPGVAVAAGVGVLAFIALALLWSAAWAGFTVSVLWGWFVVPIFGLPALTVAQAYGLALVIRLAQGVGGKYEKFQGDSSEAMAVIALGQPLICGLALLSGWVAKCFT